MGSVKKLEFCLSICKINEWLWMTLHYYSGWPWMTLERRLWFTLGDSRFSWITLDDSGWQQGQVGKVRQSHLKSSRFIFMSFQDPKFWIFQSNWHGNFVIQPHIRALTWGIICFKIPNAFGYTRGPSWRIQKESVFSCQMKSVPI